jgi:phenylalanyl-tRNA synthetase beta subunit
MKASYQEMDLTIPAFVMRDKKLNGMQKPMFALYYKMNKSEENLTFYPLKTAQIFDTRVDDICYNFNQLLAKGYIINLSGHQVSPSSTDLVFKVNPLKLTTTAQSAPKQETENQLF